MRSLVLAVLLAAASTAALADNDVVEAPEMIVTHEAVDLSDVAELPMLPAAASWRQMSWGLIGNNRLLAKTTHVRVAIENEIRVQDVTFNTDPHQINAIRVIHVGTNEGSFSSRRSGGLERNFVTIRLQSARSHGYHYQIEIYGR